jgi:uncharacterized protein YlxP (DUF503 family)
MVVGSMTIQLFIPTTHSLKEKRSVIRSVIARLRNEFNISVAEVGEQDRWQLSVIGIACVSSDAPYLDGQMQAILNWLADNRPDLEVSRADIEIY